MSEKGRNTVGTEDTTGFSQEFLGKCPLYMMYSISDKPENHCQLEWSRGVGEKGRSV
jgi:hypothetical protein